MIKNQDLFKSNSVEQEKISKKYIYMYPNEKEKMHLTRSFESFPGVLSALKRHPVQVIQEILENGIEI